MSNTDLHYWIDIYGSTGIPYQLHYILVVSGWENCIHVGMRLQHIGNHSSFGNHSCGHSMLNQPFVVIDMTIDQSYFNIAYLLRFPISFLFQISERTFKFSTPDVAFTRGWHHKIKPNIGSRVNF